MKVIHLSSSIKGGAGIAAVRYHNLSKSLGYQSKLYYNSDEISNDDSIIAVAKKEAYLTKIKKIAKTILPSRIKSVLKFIFCNKKMVEFQRNIYCFLNYYECYEKGVRPDIEDFIDLEDVDVIFVHWLGGFLNTYDIKRLYEKTKAKIVFSMMDMEPITGGCHYFWQCQGYRSNCFNCPALPYEQGELAHKQLQARAINIAYMHPDIFSSSLYDIQAAQSSIVHFEKYWQCYYPIDENIFKPVKRINKIKCIFSNSNTVGDSRKGFWLVLQVLFLLDRKIKEPIKFLCLTSKPFMKYKFNNISFEVFEFCNNVNDLAKIYQKADVFICSSVEDAAPMMLAEALLCGVPTVAFDCATAKQFIEDGKDGYVVERYDVQSMSDKVYTLLLDEGNGRHTSVEIHRKMVELYGINAVGRKFKQIIEG